MLDYQHCVSVESIRESSFTTCTLVQSTVNLASNTYLNMLFTLLTCTFLYPIWHCTLLMHVHIKRITYVKYNHAHVKQCYISIFDDTTMTQLSYILYLVYSMSEVENVTSY